MSPLLTGKVSVYESSEASRLVLVGACILTERALFSVFSSKVPDALPVPFTVTVPLPLGVKTIS